MTKLAGISGGLRRDSCNTTVLRAAAGLMPEGAELVVHTIRGSRRVRSSYCFGETSTR